MERLRGAVVGVGSMGWNHARVLNALPQVELVGVSDPDTGRRDAATDAFGCPAYATLDALIEARPDFAIVATPNRLHAPAGLELLAAGVHVLIEKPIAPTVAEAEQLIAAARAAGRKLMVGHVERFNPAVRTALAACEGESIVSVAVTRVGPFPPRMSDIGVVIDLAVHDIDIIRAVAKSEIVQVQSQLAYVRADREDTALLQFRTANDIIAQINTNWVTPFKARTVQIATKSKFITADLINRQVNEYFDYRADGSYGTRHLSVAITEPLREQLLAFVTAIAEDRPVPVTGEDGLKNLEVALECLGQGAAGSPAGQAGLDQTARFTKSM